jgi:hypothetical protein
MNVKLTLFSVDDANKLLPELKPELLRLRTIKREFDRLQTRIDVLSLAAAGAAPENPDALDLRRLLERRAALGEQLSKGVEAIHARGVLLKDLDQGLVDFYALLGDRLVFLCWQIGEREVAHWHTLEGGYSRRQPLDRSELE